MDERQALWTTPDGQEVHVEPVTGKYLYLTGGAVPKELILKLVPANEAAHEAEGVDV